MLVLYWKVNMQLENFSENFGWKDNAFFVLLCIIFQMWSLCKDNVLSLCVETSFSHKSQAVIDCIVEMFTWSVILNFLLQRKTCFKHESEPHTWKNDLLLINSTSRPWPPGHFPCPHDCTVDPRAGFSSFEGRTQQFPVRLWGFPYSCLQSQPSTMWGHWWGNFVGPVCFLMTTPPLSSFYKKKQQFMSSELLNRV